MKWSDEMCGRFTLLTGLSTIQEYFHLQEVFCDYKQGNNISPAQQVSAIIHDDKTRLVSFRWGLIPSWAKDTSISTKTINARAETLAIKPSFKNAFIKRRCLIIADGFYEWQKHSFKKIPFHFSLKSGAPFGFAGLYEIWKAPGGELVKTCTIITTVANELLRPVHDRMPVIVPKGKESLWIDTNFHDQGELMSILKPYPAEEMKMAAGFLSCALATL